MTTRDVYVAPRELSDIGIMQHMVDNHDHPKPKSGFATQEEIDAAVAAHFRIDHKRTADHDHRA